jgi:acetoacetyl-CoA synthetase
MSPQHTHPVWQPDAARIAASRLTRFAEFARQHHGAPQLPADPREAWLALHAWSLDDPPRFWESVWDFAGCIGDRGIHTLADGNRMPGARWFEDTRLNYAENLLNGHEGELAVIACDEGGGRQTLTRGQLRREVQSLATYFASLGVQAGDVVAGHLPNGSEALIAMLATAYLGAAWTSTSPDFGASGIVERIGQAAPKLLVACLEARYAGKRVDCAPTLAEVLRALPSITHLILVGGASTRTTAIDLAFDMARIHHWEDVPRDDSASALPPLRVPFNSPLFILYSSGTTGKPKAIIHGVGGTLLQHVKEHQLHTDIRPGDRVFFYTTCGWMMWNWLMSALASRATLLLYDGSPTHPDMGTLWRLAESERISVFGTSPRYLAALEQSGYRPRAQHDLSALRTVLSTGSPLSASQFDFVYTDIHADLHLASISGGTDIVSCFLLGVPWLPVHRGELQGAGLGMATDVADDNGKSLARGRGELVCRAAFPSMPLGFVGDPEGRRYRAAYYERFPGIWHHGDYAERSAGGGFTILGRSDAVLNPGGVRIGTAEIYRQVEKVPGIAEALAIGQRLGQDERIVLFVLLCEGVVLDATLEQRIRDTIRRGTTPRHVPARIVAVPDLPRTLSGKLVEVAVRNVVHDLPVQNREALANPESLELFRNLRQLTD